MKELESAIKSIDKGSKEYYELQEILVAKDRSETNVLKMITRHLGNFSQGVLASIIANKLNP